MRTSTKILLTVLLVLTPVAVLSQSTEYWHNKFFRIASEAVVEIKGLLTTNVDDEVVFAKAVRIPGEGEETLLVASEDYAEAADNMTLAAANTYTYEQAVILAMLPTADPGDDVSVWNDGGTLKISRSDNLDPDEPLPDCTQDSDCEADEECIGNICVEVAEPDCSDDGDCEEGEVCTAGECVTAPVVTENAWYVDNTVATSGDGEAWATAWKNFSDIVWVSITPGDTIYISGGATSKTYNEQIVVGASGTAGNQITITKGTDSGHNGTVVLRGAGNNSETGSPLPPTRGVDLNYPACRGYITVSNLTFENWGYAAIQGQGQSINGHTVHNTDTMITGVIVDGNTITTTGEQSIILQSSKDCVARNNNITILPTHANSGNGDAIYAQCGENFTAEDNIILNQNTTLNPHSDCFQPDRLNGLTISGNYCEQDNKKWENATGLMSNRLTGTINITDNIFYLKSASTPINLIVLRESQIETYEAPYLGGSDLGRNQQGGAAVVTIDGNTVYADSSDVYKEDLTTRVNTGYLIAVRNANDPTITNNIALSKIGGTALAIFAETGVSITTDAANITNNLLKRLEPVHTDHVAAILADATPFANNTTGYRHDAFQSAGFNLPIVCGASGCGLNADPDFEDPENGDFTPNLAAAATASTTGSYIGAVDPN